MGVLLDNGRYQVLENLLTQPDYTASVCIDIEQKNNYKPLVFNIYTQPEHINSFLPLFYGIRPGDCDEFRRVIPGYRCIMAVFNYHIGVTLTEHLKTLPKNDYPAKAAVVGSFLDAAIVLDMLPPVFALAALTPPNTVFDSKENAVRFNFIIKPDAEASEEMKRAIFISYLENAFVKNRYLPYETEDFLERMRSADISKFVPICAAWRQVNAAAMEQYEEYLKESIIGYLKRRVRRWVEKRKRKRMVAGH